LHLTDASIGVLQLKVVSGKGLKSSKLGGGQPDREPVDPNRLCSYRR
jgi:hypothetical protein